MTYPEVLNKTEIFSRTSTKISFLLFSFMDLFAAFEFIVVGLKNNFPKIGLGMFNEESTCKVIGSFTMCGFIWSEEVNYGYPKSMTSSNIS